MTEFRYHRITHNETGWQKPHGGRLGKSTDYVGQTGFGHEDWNFAGDLWDDGKCHLYVRSQPAKGDLDKPFNIILGAHTSVGHCAVAFCENVRFTTAHLPEHVLKRRARDLVELQKRGDLSAELQNLSKNALIDFLRDDPEFFSVSVHPNDLLILKTPLLIPDRIVKRTYTRYGLMRLTSVEYATLRSNAGTTDAWAYLDNASEFPEGAIIERVHRERERDSSIVKRAKNRFVATHGCLHCEACTWEPSSHFKNTIFTNSVIEAHHDVPLSSSEHTGRTKIDELKMLCPNCHRAIHRLGLGMRVEEFRNRYFK